jgi:hypothetical protein
VPGSVPFWYLLDEPKCATTLDSMLPSYRAWLARPLLAAFGCGALFSLACGGVAIDGEDEPGDMFGDGGSGFGGSAGGSATAGGNGGSGARGGAGGNGARGGAGGSGGSFSTGGVGGTGSAGFAGTMSFAGASGSAGSVAMPESSVCVDLSGGLAGLPSQAFPASDELALDLCGSEFSSSFEYQAVCLPAPGNGQSCSSFYPENLISLLYECGRQSSASFVCGPDRPLPGTVGCAGNECCYVLAGTCPGAP